MEGAHGELRSRLSHALRSNGAAGVPNGSELPRFRKVFTSECFFKKYRKAAAVLMLYFTCCVEKYPMELLFPMVFFPGGHSRWHKCHCVVGRSRVSGSSRPEPEAEAQVP